MGFWYPAQKKISLGRMVQTPRAGTGDSVGRFRRHHCSTLINYDSNLSMCGTVLKKLLPPPDNRELMPTPREAYDLDLRAVTREFGHSTPRTLTWIFCIKQLYNPGLLPSPR